MSSIQADNHLLFKFLQLVKTDACAFSLATLRFAAKDPNDGDMLKNLLQVQTSALAVAFFDRLRSADGVAFASKSLPRDLQFKDFTDDLRWLPGSFFHSSLLTHDLGVVSWAPLSEPAEVSKSWQKRCVS